MNQKARDALRTIQECLTAKRYRVLRHFTQRMDQRGLFWPDVEAVIDEPDDVRSDGRDEHDRPKWIIAGKTTDRLDVEIVCVIDRDERGKLTVFITAYWQE